MERRTFKACVSSFCRSSTIARACSSLMRQASFRPLENGPFEFWTFETVMDLEPRAPLLAAAYFDPDGEASDLYLRLHQVLAGRCFFLPGLPALDRLVRF